MPGLLQRLLDWLEPTRDESDSAGIAGPSADHEPPDRLTDALISDADPLQLAIQTVGSVLQRLAPRLEPAGRALEQAIKIQARREHFHHLLERRLDSRELTYGRYAGAVDRVCRQALANLSQAGDALGLADEIDEVGLLERIRLIDEAGALTDARARERAALEERLALRRVQLERVERCLVENEEAITGIVDASAEIATLQSLDAAGGPRMDSVLEDLEALARRVKHYR